MKQLQRIFTFVLRWSFLLLVAGIPFLLQYLTKDPFAISRLNIWSLGLVGLVCLAVVTRTIPFSVPKHRPFWVMIGGLFLAMAWALLFTDPIRNGVGLWTSRLVQPFLVGLCGYQLLSAGVVKPKEITAAFFVSLLGLLVAGTMQYVGIIEYRDVNRITATYFYPNTFARYLDIILLVSLPWIIFQAKYKRLSLGFWLLGIVLLLTTHSYNGVVTLVAGMVTFLLLLPSPFAATRRLILFSLVGVALLVGFNVQKLPKYQTTITDSRLTRLEFWQVATNILKDKNYFWTGIGIKTWEKEYPRLVETYYVKPYNRLPLNWGSVQPHNVFLDSLIKAGLPGLIAITCLLLWPITEGVALAKTYRQHNPDWWIGVSLAAYGVGMFVFGLIDDPIWSDDTVPVLFILYFMLAFVVTRRRGYSRRET